MKTKLTKVANAWQMPFDDLIVYVGQKVSPQHVSGTGRSTWLTEEGMEELTIALQAPSAVPDVLYATVKRPANNLKWVWAVIEGVGQHTVFIPRKLRGKLIGKRIPVHAITDTTGTTYRHADLA